jgi:hypothetical protein
VFKVVESGSLVKKQFEVVNDTLDVSKQRFFLSIRNQEVEKRLVYRKVLVINLCNYNCFNLKMDFHFSRLATRTSRGHAQFDNFAFSKESFPDCLVLGKT